MDFGAYGYLAPPRNPDAARPGRRDLDGQQRPLRAADVRHRRPRSPPSGEVWHAFVRDYSRRWPIAEFQRPRDIVEAQDRPVVRRQARPVDALDDLRSGSSTAPSPARSGEIDAPGLLYSQGCGGWMVDPVQAELGPGRWDDDVAAWVRRARRGTGVHGPYGSTTAYWFGQGSWGGPLVGKCPEKKDKGHGHDKPPKPPKPPKPDEAPPPAGGGNGELVPMAATTAGLVPFLPFVASLPLRRRPIRRRIGVLTRP